MKFLKHIILSVLFLTIVSCKKDKVDGSSMKSFQSSINDMASGLSTIKQVKFNEALYIIKKFGVEAEGDINEMNATAKLLEGKNVNEIFSLADEIAKKNNIDWASTAPPSLGEMNIFNNDTAKEVDHNDIKANGLVINVKPASVDSIQGAKAMIIAPILVDGSNKPVQFSDAALETTMEIYSNGVKLQTSKNLMTNNNFKGFYVALKNLPADKIVDNKIDVKVVVKTTNKNYQLTKMGISINPKALVTIVPDDPETNDNPEEIDPTTGDSTNPTPTEPQKPVADPKTTVSKFINSIDTHNLKAAYDLSNNPSWGSYDSFSNASSGFGSVKNISVKNISTANKSEDQATVNAVYNVTDNQGKSTELNVTYNLKATSGDWKITGYKINSSK